MAGEAAPSAIYAELVAAVGELRARGLGQAAKWAAEQLVGLPPGAADAGAPAAAAAAAAAAAVPEHPRLLQGRAYFEAKEYGRAAHVLGGVPGRVAPFLRCYALYLAGERRREEERVELSGPLGNAATVNQNLDQVVAELEGGAAGGALAGDGAALYLRALCEIDRDHRDSARQLLVAAVTAMPCNWSAWQALVGLCDDLDAVSGLALPGHWARHFFLASLCLELQHNAEALSRLQVIDQIFPGSDWVAGSAAQAHYNARNFDEAQALFEDLLQRDPHRLQGMDTYSNILFVKEAFAPLSHLAHRLAAGAKYSPEACCVAGNYYSLKGAHERRAWTLMGHEYVELKNAPAAIEAYRSAVCLNARDYRAWYGLGQTYELLGMPVYALHYYRRAALLRPGDPRMWCALGHCYEAEGLASPGLALRCYRRAVAHGDREGIALARLAKLHEAQGEAGQAAHYYALNLARLDGEGAGGADVTEALLFLAEYAKLQPQQPAAAAALAQQQQAHASTPGGGAATPGALSIVMDDDEDDQDDMLLLTGGPPGSAATAAAGWPPHATPRRARAAAAARRRRRQRQPRRHGAGHGAPPARARAVPPPRRRGAPGGPRRGGGGGAAAAVPPSPSDDGDADMELAGPTPHQAFGGFDTPPGAAGGSAGPPPAPPARRGAAPRRPAGRRDARGRLWRRHAVSGVSQRAAMAPHDVIVEDADDPGELGVHHLARSSVAPSAAAQKSAHGSSESCSSSSSTEDDAPGWLRRRVLFAACLCILGNELCERLAFYGLQTNMGLYLKKQLAYPADRASQLLQVWKASVYLTPLLSAGERPPAAARAAGARRAPRMAYLADAVAGRFWVILAFSSTYFVGMLGITLVNVLPATAPVAGGDPPPAGLGVVRGVFWLFMYLTALGSGGIKPCVSTFGGDQFRQSNAWERKALSSFFTWFYFCINIGAGPAGRGGGCSMRSGSARGAGVPAGSRALARGATAVRGGARRRPAAAGALVASTVVVGVQESKGYGVGFGIPTAAFGGAILLFIGGGAAGLYTRLPPEGSPFTRIARVLRGAVAKRRLPLPADPAALHDPPPGTPGALPFSMAHTRRMRVTEVEEAKAFIGVLPLFGCLCIYQMTYDPIFTLLPYPGDTMDRSLGSLTVPASSISFANTFGVLLTVVATAPGLGRARHATPPPAAPPAAPRQAGPAAAHDDAHRAGLCHPAARARASAALIEGARYKVVASSGLRQAFLAAGPGADYLDPAFTQPMSIWWQAVPYFLLGVSEVFTNIGAMELFFTQVSEGMRSLGASVYLLTVAVGTYAGSALNAVVAAAAPGDARWVADNPLFGRYDCYFWLNFGILALGLGLYWILVARRYAETPLPGGPKAKGGGDGAPAARTRPRDAARGVLRSIRPDL
ncbi:APC8 [Scenedesmus sp. PABB004]|nr:APC8 [Scenedesmus sp. PABB004]